MTAVVRPFVFRALNVVAEQVGPKLWAVTVTVSAIPADSHNLYVQSPAAANEVLIEFCPTVSAEDAAEACYRGCMAAYEHELLERIFQDGKMWCNPHEQKTPMGALPVG